MSKLKQKSLFNIEAAKLLIDNSLYCSSVHCSYYSCFQLLKFIIKDFFGIDYNTLGIQIANSRKSTHQYIIEYIESQIQNNIGLIKARNFKHKIKDLKLFREDSDYENVDVDIVQGKKAFTIAEEIRKDLSKTFHV